MTAPTRVGLVACASVKLQHPAPAGELYRSQLFRKAASYAALTCDRWYVLSAKHGLVSPAEVLAPYNVKLGTRGGPPIWTWADRVRDQLAVELVDVPAPLLVVLAGAQYRTILQRSPWPSVVPMEGLGIGEQLSWLTRELAAVAA